LIRTVLALALCIVALVLVVVLDGPEAESPAVTPSFAGSARCGECHEEEYGAWRGSHHDLAMQYATEETVLGDFDDAVFEHGGVTYRFTRNDGSYQVHVDGERYPAPFTFGVEPLQQVLLDVGKGRFQALPVAWDVANERWYAWYEEPFDLHEPRFTWNHMCAACHSTDFRKNWDESAQAYASTFEEIDVACESCHGPGRQHADDPERPIGTLDCAHCHSRRAQLHDNTFGDFPGAHAPALITEPLYYSDGQIRDEVYVWGSFQQSKMHGVGVTCLDCHDPHSARLLREGNAVCTECHRLDPPERFPTLKKRDYETYAHHNHDPGSVRCVECHMPARVYMGIDERRDHSFRVPRPDLAASIGVPNACNACHLDRPPEWAAEAMLGMGDGTAAQRPHFGTAFASGDVAGLVRVAFDEAQPEIVRASAIVRLAGRGEPEAREAVEEAAASRLPLMRLAAVRAGARDLDPLLQDEAEAVALEAAARLGVLNEPLRRHLDYLADVAEGPYNLACPGAMPGSGWCGKPSSSTVEWMRCSSESWFGNVTDAPSRTRICGGKTCMPWPVPA